MLTIDANDAAIIRNPHTARVKKQMVVILPESSCSDWRVASEEATMEFLKPYLPEQLITEAEKYGIWTLFGHYQEKRTCDFS